MPQNEISNPKSEARNPSDAFENMDRMYRYQRFFYDFTRKYYLLGRDRLLAEMEIADGDNVLEVGCGTARNLIILAKKYPGVNFYGLDASAEMLKTAQAKIDQASIKNICLKTALADDFDFRATFNLDRQFDAIYFSYALSIIPSWQTAVENALRNLKSGKSFYIVDFYDQKHLPAWFRKILQKWLEQFHVKYPENLIPYLTRLDEKSFGRLTVKPLFYHYSFLADFQLF